MVIFGIWYLVFGIRFWVFGFGYLVFGFRVFGTWFGVFNIWYLVINIQYSNFVLGILVFGIRYLVFNIQIWFWVFGILFGIWYLVIFYCIRDLTAQEVMVDTLTNAACSFAPSRYNETMITPRMICAAR